MRWDDLFGDLEAQAAVLEQAERAGEVDERTRGEVGALGLVERAGGSLGSPVRVRVRGDGAVAGPLVRVGPDWLLVDEGAGREALVALPQVVSLRGLARWSSAPASGGVVAGRLGLRTLLRGIARDRSLVRVHLDDGSALDGTLDRVGADFAEMAVHAPGEARRRQEVHDVAAIPLAVVTVVRRTA